MSDQVRQEALRSKTQQLLQGPLRHVKAAALAAALVPLAVVAVRSAAPDGMCSASAGACGFVFVDTNGNGLQDAGEQPYGVWTDANHNGTIDVEWVDANANGHVDGKDEWVDVNHNGVLDADEWIDLNHDGILDKGEGWVDFNGNGVVDAGEWIDVNHNGVLDADEWIDLNNNGVPDAGEGWVDFNGDDTLGKSEWTDLNGNGVVDASEWQGAIVTLTQTDCTTDCITLTTSTDQYGKFEFPASAGTFTVSVQIPPRFTASPSNNPDAPDETFDSDGVPNAAGTWSVVEGLRISGPEAIVDFGFVPKIDAADDAGAVVHSNGGGTSVTDVLANDTLSGVPVTSGQVTLTQVSSTNPGVNLTGTDVVVAPGTPPGTYTVVYQICEVSTTNCDTASVTVPVRSIDAVDDAGAVVDGRVGGTSYANVLVNDTLNGVLVASGDVTTSLVSSSNPGVTLNGTSVNVAAGTAPGDYALVYQICDKVDPTLCDTATVSVPVRSIDAVNDAGSVVNGTTGGVSYANVLVNDTLNGTPVVAGQVITTLVSSSNPGVTLSGTSVVVAAGTLAGNYTLVYRICDQLNAWICDTATVTVPVTVPVQPPAPSLSLTKTANSLTYSYVGQTIVYTYVIQNTGAVAVSGPFTVTDDKLGAFLCGSANLSPGASLTCTKSYVIQVSDLGNVTALPTAVGATVYTGAWLQGVMSTQDTTITGAGSGVPDGIYPGWCIQDHVPLDLHNQHGTLYSTIGGSLPADVVGLPWGKINWVLNHKIRGAGKNDLAFFKDVQTAIWRLLGEPNPDFGVSATAQQMINEANAHPTFVPGPSDVVAVIIYSDGMGTAAGSIQESIIELKPPQSITNHASGAGTSGTTPVSSNTAQVTVNQTMQNAPTPSGAPGQGPAVDKTVFSDGVGTRTTQPFSTAGTAELLIALVASDGPSSGGQQITVSGAGLSWTLVKRVNSQLGSAEIWKAWAAGMLTNVSVSATQKFGGYHQSLTVVSFTGATGVGASIGASAASGAPTASLTTTRANSFVYGVGNDWDHATGRVLGPNQLFVHQWIDTQIGDTYWVQARAAGVPAVGTVVQLNDAAPTTDRWNFAIVEIVK